MIKMLLPLRCPTCNKLLNSNADKYFEEYKELGYSDKQILDMFGVINSCCRSVIMNNVRSELEYEYKSIYDEK